MSAVAASQRDFVSKYVQLLGLATPLTPDNFNSVSDYSKVQSLGPSLPKVNTPLPNKEQSEKKDSFININFKSIKPPFKFTTSLNEYSSSHSIYKTKLDLIASLPLLKDAHVAPKHIKLLLKGKVLHDLSLLSSLNLDQDLSFTCMVATPEIEQSASLETVDTQEKTDEKSPINILSETWTKIQEALLLELNTEDATTVLSKFKSSIV
ncbi:uncharacterized protein KQ657_000170 [Scheffersomyces spartinae]|uniref:Ubiquitin-like domain-containing protein n=1 Tax=Scheffersomyces spartinae TaxID=45513 RepID=A0A9P8AKT4_9ASCO|nr:uncharacterized protein KQ657_000170 [Scheffersomyces spartinae]KAG7196158.1 hypothetical protein KQ657_000170 [Scheffersomyces spartinae]